MHKILVLIGLSILGILTGFSHYSVNNIPNWRISDASSLNWAGYYTTGSSYTIASAYWVVPKLSNRTTGYSSAWIGIGGVNGNGLIQTGTEQDCLSGSTSGTEPRFHGPVLADRPTGSVSGPNKGGGSKICKKIYYAWWETYPINAEQKISMIVSPGDLMYASVSQISSGVWNIHLEDKTHPQSFNTTVNFNPDTSTAEAIIERPSLCFVSCRLTNLANFSTIHFSNTSAGDYFNNLNHVPITMVDNGGNGMAVPGVLSTRGTFDVTWLRSS